MKKLLPINLKPLLEDLPTALCNNIATTVLRLDKIHAHIGGNKFLKLLGYEKEIKEKKCNRVVSTGGYYSNHLYALSYWGWQNKIQTVAILKGMRPDSLSPTLQDCEEKGMGLIFIDQKQYKELNHYQETFMQAGDYWINSGGYGVLGTVGVQALMEHINQQFTFTHIICACGTGTTLAGLCLGAQAHQKIIGVSVLKGHESLENEIVALLPYRIPFTILNNYHQGGYARYTKELLQFMSSFFDRTGIPSDFVYTGKLFFALADLYKQQYFTSRDKVLVIHSGGIQGNRGLRILDSFMAL
ncbi:MAG: pyridoxal-phosphate dependent enzyme [Phycisphaerales bacterium]|nr:pyridoxal-phosphate dependent enzyme [Phycisphaerales bacterium]